MINRDAKPAPKNLPSLFRGFYGRVASRLDVDPSYVSRVARGERQSEEVEAALEVEMRQIMKALRSNRNGFGRRSTNHNGSGSNRASRGSKSR